MDWLDSAARRGEGLGTAGRLARQDGRARLRGRHGGPHRGRLLRPGGHPGAAQAPRLSRTRHAPQQHGADAARAPACCGSAGSASTAAAACSSGALAVSAFAATQAAAAAAGLSWMLAEWLHSGKPTALGLASGIVAGLVAVTPASGFVYPWGGLAIGLIAGVVCYWLGLPQAVVQVRRLARRLRRPRRRRLPRRGPDRRVLLQGWSTTAAATTACSPAGSRRRSGIQFVAAAASGGLRLRGELDPGQADRRRLIGFTVDAKAETKAWTAPSTARSASTWAWRWKRRPEQPRSRTAGRAGAAQRQKRFTVVVEGADNGELMQDLVGAVPGRADAAAAGVQGGLSRT